MGYLAPIDPEPATMQPPQSYSVGGQRSSGQLTGKPAGARQDHRGHWCAICVQAGLQHVAFAHNTDGSAQDRVVPDPPVGLNWTLLNISQTGQHFDILIQWEPPPSADVKKGWISLVYEPQYRAINMSDWKPLEVERARYQSVYGLKTGMEYEIRVRCKQAASEKFSEFSDHLYVYIPKVPTKVERKKGYDSESRPSREDERYPASEASVKGARETPDWPRRHAAWDLKEGQSIEVSIGLRTSDRVLKRQTRTEPRVRSCDRTEFGRGSALTHTKITELQGKNNILDIKLDEASRLLKLGQTKETCMKEAEMKETELKDAIVRKEAEIQAMKKQLKDQEREKQSEIIKLQMEFNAKLARIQSTSVKAQHQDPSILAQNIFKRKLQFLQEEKNRETEALRRTIKELEQQLNSPHDSHLKRRRQFFYKFFQDFKLEPLVEIEGVSNLAFRHLIEFTYTAKLAVSGNEEVSDVWKAAEYLQMQEAIKALNSRTKSSSPEASKQSPMEKNIAKKRKIAETSNVITETLPSVELPLIVCSMVFNSWDQFKDHLVVHTGDKPNHCTICDIWFTQAGDMRKHLREFHAIHERVVTEVVVPEQEDVEDVHVEHVMVEQVQIESPEVLETIESVEGEPGKEEHVHMDQVQVEEEKTAEIQVHQPQDEQQSSETLIKEHREIQVDHVQSSTLQHYLETTAQDSEVPVEQVEIQVEEAEVGEVQVEDV
ncbi:UNVERIFIED_CONTAM: hypothetical protein FKN15_014218 [Acipenser sinensis]